MQVQEYGWEQLEEYGYLESHSGVEDSSRVILHGEAENDQLFSAFFSAVSIAFKRIMEVYF